MIKELRAFIRKGTLVQLAVAFLMGVASATPVGPFINDIVMPVIGAAAIYSRASVTNLVNSLLIASVVFMLVRAHNRPETVEEMPVPTPKAYSCCKTAIHVPAVRCSPCTSQPDTA
jgi:large-conductance mechanosensitive channel